MAELLDWEGRFGARTLLDHALRSPSSLGDVTPPAPGVALGVKAVAEVYSGRWGALCPFDGCGGAEYISFDEKLFFCCECRNATVGNQPILVEVPAPGKRRDIEAYLTSRPVPATRTWLAFETVADLRDQNRSRGIKLVKAEVA